jgi:DNA-binding transcriptional LysR family regulator
MEIKWLEDFVALAEHSSFSRAAEMRNVTQPAFSRRIKQLETWLGAALVSRATMPAELTPAGRSFLPMAQETIRAFYAARETLRPIAEADLVRFAALHTLTLGFFPRWLTALETSASGLRTSFIPDRGGLEANLAALVEGEADFLLTYAHPQVPFHLEQSRFVFMTIGHDRLVPVTAPLLRIEGGPQPGAGLLDRAVTGRLTVPYLSYGFSSFFGVALGRLFATQPPFRRHTVHENTISIGLMMLALAGNGLAWLPESLVQADLDAGRLVRATRDETWTMGLDIRLFRHREGQSRPVEALWQAAADVLARGAMAGAVSAADGRASPASSPG